METITCSFCNDSSDRLPGWDAMIIANDQLAICSKCVEICNETIANYHRIERAKWDMKREVDLRGEEVEEK